MYFNFVCSNCGKTLKVREELAGRKAKCPYCRSAVTVPDRTATDEEAGDESQASSVTTGGGGPTAGSEPAARTPAAGAALPQIAVGPKPGAGPPSIPSRPRVQPHPSGRKKPAANENDDGTNVSMLWTALVGLGVTLGYYIILLPLPTSYFRDLFYDRGWVTVAETFLLFWSLAILAFKLLKLRRQRESMLFDLLPDSLGRDITSRVSAASPPASATCL
jgi:DNA-directed RNA polymerase subunit RPC12/RpoP